MRKTKVVDHMNFKNINCNTFSVVLNPHGIEPTFFKLYLWSQGGRGSYSYYNLQCIKLDKEGKNTK